MQFNLEHCRILNQKNHNMTKCDKWDASFSNSVLTKQVLVQYLHPGHRRVTRVPQLKFLHIMVWHPSNDILLPIPFPLYSLSIPTSLRSFHYQATNTKASPFLHSSWTQSNLGRRWHLLHILSLVLLLLVWRIRNL
jgi:hypothetical protein